MIALKNTPAQREDGLSFEMHAELEPSSQSGSPRKARLKRFVRLWADREPALSGKYHPLYKIWGSSSVEVDLFASEIILGGSRIPCLVEDLGDGNSCTEGENIRRSSPGEMGVSR